MPTLKDIKKRIRSVKSTQKITRAMKLVAAAKLRRAQEAILTARPYAEELHDILSRVARKSGSAHPALVAHSEPKKVLLMIMTSDRGMCGGFNTNIIRRAEDFIREREGTYELEVGTIGRKGRDYFNKHSVTLRKDYAGVFESLSYDQANRIASELTRAFVEGGLDVIYLLYNEFKSAISQKVHIEQLLPVKPQAVSEHEAVIDYIYEPSKEALLEELVPAYLATEIWRALLESTASEHGARMTAMDAATTNASDMIERLTLKYNRARQAAITRELVEIVSGAEAL